MDEIPLHGFGRNIDLVNTSMPRFGLDVFMHTGLALFRVTFPIGLDCNAMKLLLSNLRAHACKCLPPPLDTEYINRNRLIEDTIISEIVHVSRPLPRESINILYRNSIRIRFCAPSSLDYVGSKQSNGTPRLSMNQVLLCVE